MKKKELRLAEKIGLLFGDSKCLKKRITIEEVCNIFGFVAQYDNRKKFYFNDNSAIIISPEGWEVDIL